MPIYENDRAVEECHPGVVRMLKHCSCGREIAVMAQAYEGFPQTEYAAPVFVACGACHRFTEFEIGVN